MKKLGRPKRYGAPTDPSSPSFEKYSWLRDVTMPYKHWVLSPCTKIGTSWGQLEVLMGHNFHTALLTK